MPVITHVMGALGGSLELERTDVVAPTVRQETVTQTLTSECPAESEVPAELGGRQVRSLQTGLRANADRLRSLAALPGRASLTPSLPG